MTKTIRAIFTAVAVVASLGGLSVPSTAQAGWTPAGASIATSSVRPRSSSPNHAEDESASADPLSQLIAVPTEANINAAVKKGLLGTFAKRYVAQSVAEMRLPSNMKAGDVTSGQKASFLSILRVNQAIGLGLAGTPQEAGLPSYLNNSFLPCKAAAGIQPGTQATVQQATAAINCMNNSATFGR